MHARSLLLPAILALGAAPLTAQSRPADPLSGIWTGYIGRSEASPSSATFELKLAPDGSVTGRVTGSEITPGEIKAGSFDRATGVLTFTVVIQAASGDAGGSVKGEGRLVGDSLAGKLLLDGETGVFKLTRGAAGSAPSASAGKTVPPPSDARPALRRSFVEVSGWIARAVELVPADKFSYRPAPTVRSLGQLVGHMVDGANYYCGRAAGKSVEWSDATEKGVSAKAALIPALKQAFGACTSAYETGGQVAPLVENVGHSSLHYGNLVTYLRMLGLTPPSS